MRILNDQNSTVKVPFYRGILLKQMIVRPLRWEATQCLTFANFAKKRRSHHITSRELSTAGLLQRFRCSRGNSCANIAVVTVSDFFSFKDTVLSTSTRTFYPTPFQREFLTSDLSEQTQIVKRTSSLSEVLISLKPWNRAKHIQSWQK